MKTDERITERRAELEDLKKALANDLEVALGAAAFRAEAPEICIEVTPFRPADVEVAMPGRHWDHERIAFTQQVIADILNHIVNYGVITHACMSKGVSSRTLEELVKQYPALMDLKDEAKNLYRDKVSRAVHNRAIEGWLEPVFYKGSLVGFVRKFSDRMLELQAKRYIPEYRDRSAMDVNVAGGVLVVNGEGIPDKEAWLEEQRKRRKIESRVIDS